MAPNSAIRTPKFGFESSTWKAIKGIWDRGGSQTGEDELKIAKSTEIPCFSFLFQFHSSMWRMSIILRDEDAKDWVYKGEGGANLVLSYCGSSPNLVGKVLRVRKVSKERTHSSSICEVLSEHGKLLWGHISEIAKSASKENVEHAFVMHVMSPLLDSRYIDAGIWVTVTRDFLESVEKSIHSQRPAGRVDSSALDSLCASALLVSDHTVFRSAAPQDDICIAVEIKPKCGVLPSSEFIAQRNSVKKHITRFKMHQSLKLKHGEILQMSDYDPLDLFSGSKDRIYKAILALFATPQNNFRIFLNGSLIFGFLGGSKDSGSAPSHEKEKIEDLIKAGGLELDGFLELVAEIIFKSGVLDRLQAAQKLDVFDIEGVIHAYYNIISQPCTVCRNLSDDDLLQQCSYLHSLTLEESIKIVREFLIAATAKDASLIICFKPSGCKDSASEFSSICLESNKSFDYKAYFIDLDMKPLDKMPYYYDLDQKIVNFYTKN